MKSCKIPIRFFALKYGQRLNLILLYVDDELQTQTRQRYHKYQQGKEDSCDALIKATSITNKDTKRNNCILQTHQYCTCELFEELICKKIDRLTYMG
jgi:hypothetical protein